MAAAARLVRLDGPAGSVSLGAASPLTIGRDPANGFCLAGVAGVSRRHAELRPSGNGQWLLCDLGSSNGTFLEGERLQGCRLLNPGDRIRLGRRGPLLQFLSASPAPAPQRASPAPAPDRGSPAPAIPPPGPLPGPSPGPSPGPALLEGSIVVAGRRLPLDQIRAVELRHEALHPHLFSWWLLACLGGLLLLPFPLLFWPWQIGSLALAILLARRQEHRLILSLRDGQAYRHSFTDRATALAHRNGVRRALGQSLDP